jgi:PAS domain S-box-containing protein
VKALTKKESLLRDYQELQLRVTRFSFIEQQLKNAQDKLDHELILYKRLNQFSSKALKSRKIEDFLTIAVEAIVDILEVEASALVIRRKCKGETNLYTEGILLPTSEMKEQFIEDLSNLSDIVGKSKSVVIPSKRLELLHSLSDYKDAVFHFSNDKGLEISVCLIGLVSHKKAPFYEVLDDKHETIFNLFAQQFLTILTNFFQHQKIEDQIVKITSSEIELKKLSLIATKSKNGVIITDHKGRIEWVNDSFTQTTGYAYEEVKGIQTLNILKNNFNDVEEYKKVLKDKKSIEFESLNRTKQGKPYHSQTEIIPVFDEHKNFINFIYVIKDITNEVDFKEEILRMNSRFELISNKSQIGIWEWDKETNESTWNNIMIAQYGTEKSKIGPNFFNFWKDSIYPADKEELMTNRNKILNLEIDSFEQDYRIIRANDKSIRYLKTLTIGEKDSHGQVIRLVGSSVDITERKEAHEKIKALKLFYESILNNMPNKILIFNAASELIYYNESMLASQPFWEKYMFQSLYDIMIAEVENQAFVEHLISHIRQAVKKRTTIKFNETITFGSNSTELLNNILPFYTNGVLEYIIVSGVDITELNVAQLDLVKKNNELVKVNGELDNFVYRVSHDLRAPLLSIKGLISLINFAELNPGTTEYISLIESSATRMDNSIQDILEYSRNSRLEVKLERININELVHEIFNDIKFSTDSQIELEYQADGEDSIVTDKFRMSTLLKNMIGNAIKYKRDVPESFIKFHMSQKGKTITMRVVDNGIGISKSSMPKVFDMFYRGSSASVGTGLGLYICKEIIERLNGKIKLKSKLGEGSEFDIVLPINKL